MERERKEEGERQGRGVGWGNRAVSNWTLMPFLTL